jgi:hypothetical protein
MNDREDSHPSTQDGERGTRAKYPFSSTPPVAQRSLCRRTCTGTNFNDSGIPDKSRSSITLEYRVQFIQNRNYRIAWSSINCELGRYYRAYGRSERQDAELHLETLTRSSYSNG